MCNKADNPIGHEHSDYAKSIGAALLFALFVVVVGTFGLTWRYDAAIARLRLALESLVAECDKSIRWRNARGMRTATDLSAFASTSYSGVLEIRRALQAALEKGGPPLSVKEMEAAKGAERGR